MRLDEEAWGGGDMLVAAVAQITTSTRPRASLLVSALDLSTGIPRNGHELWAYMRAVVARPQLLRSRNGLLDAWLALLIYDHGSKVRLAFTPGPTSRQDPNLDWADGRSQTFQVVSFMCELCTL